VAIHQIEGAGDFEIVSYSGFPASLSPREAREKVVGELADALESELPWPVFEALVSELYVRRHGFQRKFPFTSLQKRGK